MRDPAFHEQIVRVKMKFMCSMAKKANVETKNVVQCMSVGRMP